MVCLPLLLFFGKLCLFSNFNRAIDMWIEKKVLIFFKKNKKIIIPAISTG